MRRFFLIAVLLPVSGAALSLPAQGDMYQDGSNAKLPEALTNFGYGTQLAASVTCTTTSGNPTVTGCSGTTGLKVGMAVRGPGIPAGATIRGGITPTGFTLSADATAGGAGLITIRHLPWSTEDGGRPSVWRFPGRIFVGNAIGQPDARFGAPYWHFCPDYPSPQPCAAWAARDSDFLVMSSRGGHAVTGMSRSSDGADLATSAPSPIGVSGFLVHDTATGGSGWASYFDVQLDPAAEGKYAFGSEIAVKNKGANHTANPYSADAGGYGIRLSAGGDPAYGGAAVNSSNTAIHIATIAGGGPPNTWNKGIVFMAQALTGTTGFTGCCGSAIEMARGHMIDWTTGTGELAFNIASVITDPAGAMQIFAQENNLSFLGNSGGSKIFQMANVPSAVNRLQVKNAVTGGAPELTAASETDPNVGLALKPQGSGTVNPSVGIKLPNYTVATLPACNAGYTYVMAAVSDASAPTYNATITGGGAVKTLVMCDGAAWKAH